VNNYKGRKIILSEYLGKVEIRKEQLDEIISLKKTASNVFSIILDKNTTFNYEFNMKNRNPSAEKRKIAKQDLINGDEMKFLSGVYIKLTNRIYEIISPIVTYMGENKK
jgi:hypothetical protein